MLGSFYCGSNYTLLNPCMFMKRFTVAWKGMNKGC